MIESPEADMTICKRWICKDKQFQKWSNLNFHKFSHQNERYFFKRFLIKHGLLVLTQEC